MRITLTVTAGPHKGKVFMFSGHDTFLVGRSKDAHFRLPKEDLYFSRVHFMVEMNPPQCRLMDMGSRNGTHVNGQRVAVVDLKNGDQIKAGRTMLGVTIDTANVPQDDSIAMLPPPVAAPAPPSIPAQQTTPLLPLGAETVRNVPPKPGSKPDVSIAPGPAKPQEPAPATPQAAFPTVPFKTPVKPMPVAELAPPPPLAQVAAPPAVPSLVALLCRACETPIPMQQMQTLDLDQAPTMPVCATCRELIQRHPQPIAGYRIVRELGHGAMGIVYLALRMADQTVVALKTIIPAVASSQAQVERFLREAAILRDLNHPNIVAFREMGEVEGQLYFAMDYVNGTDAYHLLKKTGPLPIARAASLIYQLLDALAYAHERGFVHRDIKPGNMLVAEGKHKDVVKLADFGLARVYQASQLSGLTMTGDLGGTIAFMPPEQITSYREAKPQADQYAAAATLYNLLADKFIFDLPNKVQQQLLMVLHEKPVPIQSRRPEVPKGLADVIHRALAKEPTARFADAKAMRDALRAFC